MIESSKIPGGYIRPLALDAFCIPERIIKSHISSRIIRMILRVPLLCISKKFKEGDGENTKGNLYLWGYFQRHQSFDAYRDDLVRIFTVKAPSKKFVEKIMWLDQLHVSNTETVAVHVRRGDYIQVGAAIKCDYQKKAMLYMLKHLKNPSFIFFSDDMDYVKLEFKEFENCVFAENWGIADVEEMMIMSRCHHQIIANSTYSWWAAYLNTYENKIVIAPNDGHRNAEWYPEGSLMIKSEKEQTHKNKVRVMK